VLVFVVWDFWQFVLVSGLFCMCNLRFSKGVIFFICFSLSQGKIIMERSRGRGGLNRNCELVIKSSYLLAVF
jgi:hypothetical protein